MPSLRTGPLTPLLLAAGTAVALAFAHGASPAHALAGIARGPGAAGAAPTVVEAETLRPEGGQVRRARARGASGGAALAVGSGGAATQRIVARAPGRLSVRWRPARCGRRVGLSVAVDGRRVLATAARGSGRSAWRLAVARRALPGGAHRVTLRRRPGRGPRGCGPVLVDWLRWPAISPRPATSSGPRGMRLYVDPDSAAHRQADAWRVSRPADAAAMDKIAAEPQAAWFGDWNANVTADVGREVGAAHAAGALPALVAYDIPGRGCGQSGGGASSAEAYKAWIRSFAAGIGARPALVILEPDALAGLDCLSSAGRSQRIALLADAVDVLAALPAAWVYLDAGHAHWHPVAETASRLRAAGVDRATGFSLNVSNFDKDDSERSYGAALSAAVGHKPFVIDTGRNGLGPAPDGSSCNPSGRALGRPPTTDTGPGLVDAYLWVKEPGSSDGACNGGPPAGTWWPDYALGLAQRAGW